MDLDILLALQSLREGSWQFLREFAMKMTFLTVHDLHKKFRKRCRRDRKASFADDGRQKRADGKCPSET